MGLFDRLFSRSRPPSEDKFAKIMADALRRAGDDRQSTYDKAEFRLLHTKDGKDAGITNLRNLYTEYCSAPKAARGTMLARTCRGLLNRMEMPDDFDDVRPDLLPTIRTRSTLDVLRLDAEIAGGKMVELPSLPLTDHLIVCLVYDLPTSMRFVNQEDLDRWGVTLDEALEVARNNLEERPYTILAAGEKLYIAESDDAYDAARLLMTQLIRGLEISGEPVAMPISRDCLLIAGDDDVTGLVLMLAVAESKRDQARPLCPIPMRLAGEAWETWQLPVNHSLYGRFKELELRYLAGEYAEQKKLHDKRNEQLGEDVFVASYSVVEREGKLLSYGVWSKTVLTWLPKTDYVALYDPETKGHHFVAWERLREFVGGMMEPLDYYPPRYCVREFPSQEQIARMDGEDWSSQQAE